MMKTSQTIGVVFAVLCYAAGLRADDDAESSRIAKELEAAKQKLTSQEYDLRYKFTAGEQARWKVVHLVTFETKIQGVSQTAKSRSISVKQWRVTQVGSDGSLTFQHVIDSVDMWQKVTGRQEIRYNSQTDRDVPKDYEHVAKTVGMPLSTITLDVRGRVLDRQSSQPQLSPWTGEITVPLPQQPIKVGGQWSLPDELTIRLPDGTAKRIKTRQLYTLVKVETGVATINVETQVLTPVDDPKIKSQLVQRLTNGTVKFDVDAGRVLSKQMDLDETVIGFSGADSLMQYLARFTEELLPTEVADAPPPEPADEPAAKENTAANEPLKDRADKPMLRR